LIKKNSPSQTTLKWAFARYQNFRKRLKSYFLKEVKRGRSKKIENYAKIQIIGRGYSLSDTSFRQENSQGENSPLNPLANPLFFLQERKLKSYRSIRKTIRFTDDEFSTIKEKMDLGNYSNFTEFALHSMINKKPSKAKSINKEYLLELSRIGNNLNQLTRKLNKGDRLNNLGLSAIIDIRDSINSLKEKI
jgi:hypothetical protein